MTDLPTPDSDAASSFHFEAFRTPTRSQLLEAASEIVPNTQVLINMVSKRVRELNYGDRPLIPVSPSMTAGMIALAEIIDGKLKYEFDAPEEE